MTLHHHPSHQNSPEMLGHTQGTAPHQYVLPMWWAPPYLCSHSVSGHCTTSQKSTQHVLAPKLEPLLYTGAKRSLPTHQRSLLWEASFALGALYFPLATSNAQTFHPPKPTDKQPLLNSSWGRGQW